MKVLIAEDDVISRSALERNIRDWGYEVEATGNGEEAWETIQSGEIRLAILDWEMPKMDGIEICRKIRHEVQQKMEGYIYVILLTGKDNQDDIVHGLTAGADDYITKPFYFPELKIRLQKGEKIILREDARIKSASVDSLTQLWNRKKILDLLEEELERGERSEQPVGVFMVDIDHFKKMNDSYGHIIGDKILSEVASRLKRPLRKYDKVGRYGGDEFLVIVTHLGSEYIKRLAQRMIESISEQNFLVDNHELKINVSIGGISSEDLPNATGEKLIEASDSALLTAKRSGRNRAVTYNETIK
ncbi:MAG: diguanylate cyclase [Candidatus Aminicenantes bacterium]|nr:diguanylate cyclase [Candidatus Aminicenantes bacterium]